MWKRWQQWSIAVCPAGACRRWAITSCCSAYSSTVVRRRPPGTSGVTAAPGADDFVDIDHLMAYQVPRHATQQPLGVTRHGVPDEDIKVSRLNIALEQQSQHSGRANSRAILPLGEEASFADKVEGSDQLASDVAPQSSSSQDPLPDPSSLPYDDEKFAEMLLEMEVNGTIDETWQDARRAHVEDVKEIADILTSLKVRDLCCIDVSEKTSNFDFIVFGTCEGSRHIHLAAWAVQEADRVHRLSKIKRAQTDELWEVVPVGRILVNLMVESFREEMTLERKWAVSASMDPLAAANAPISEGRQVRAHGLWTLTLNLQDLEDFEVDYCKDVLMKQI